MNPLSDRARSIQPSATLELAARARALRDAGRPILDMTVGEPDLPTPPPVVEAAHRALDAGHFKYTPTPGVPKLREAVAAHASERLRLPISSAQIVVSNGCKQAIYNALATATDPGDRVGVLRPYWVSYVEAARSLGCEIVAIDAAPLPDLHQLDAALERGMRLLIVNSPCNPSGAAYDAEEFAPLLDRIARHETLLLSDEIYEDIVYRPGGHVSPLHVRPELAERCCVVSGLSKSYAMTGWRIGWSIAPTSWSAAMSALQGHVSSNINAVAQQAAIAALADTSLVAPLAEAFARRRGLVLRRAAQLSGVRFSPPQGTFYLYLDVAEHLDGGDVDQLARRLLDERDLAVVPGSAFGDPHGIRLSFACSDEQIERAFDALAAHFGKRAEES